MTFEEAYAKLEEAYDDLDEAERACREAERAIWPPWSYRKRGEAAMSHWREANATLAVALARAMKLIWNE